MDHNEHVMEGHLEKALANKEGLNLSKAINLHAGASSGTTIFQGLQPIDDLWVSNNLDISNACVMPFGFVWCG